METRREPGPRRPSRRPWYEEGLRFECAPDCGRCCTNHGEYAYVYLEDGDLERLARHLELAPDDFRGRYVREDEGHTILRMDEPACPFLDGSRTADGRIYYILQAAYVAGQACGSTSPSSGAGGTPQAGNVPNPVSQLIIPVKIATPDADGRIYHNVQAGQSFWSIAIAYQITIRDLEVWNNLTRSTPLKTGQRLFIPSKNTEGYATPTPVGMVMIAAPDADGRIVHEVQPYQALSIIADAYHVSMDRILGLNGIQADWPLQIGQKLLIDPGMSLPVRR